MLLHFLCNLNITILYSVIFLKPVLLPGGGRVTSSTTFLSDVEAGGKFVFPYVSTQINYYSKGVLYSVKHGHFSMLE